MVQILETMVKVEMTLPEARVLEKVLGVLSVGYLRDHELTEPEIQVYNSIYAAFHEFTEARD